MTFSEPSSVSSPVVGHLRVRHLLALYAAAMLLRWLVAPTHNLAEDSFELIESGKHLWQTGEYRVPDIGGPGSSGPDMVLHYRLPSWPVGFPLALAGIFSLFGADESVARFFTIACSSLLAPITAGIAFVWLGRAGIAVAAGLLAAIHPLALAFGGQVFTNNLSVSIFFVAVYCLLSSLVREPGGPFLSYPQVAAAPHRLVRFGVAFLAFGLMLAVRDTDLMLMPVALYLLWRARMGEPLSKPRTADWRPWGALLLIAGTALLIGWSPSLYFNLVNFGSPLVSTHYQTGIRLSLDFLLRGSDALMGAPGLFVMGLAFALYHFPFFLALVLLRSSWPTFAPMAVMGLLVVMPILLVHGAFPVSATGAAPRYVLPLVPFTAILAACAVPWLWRNQTYRIAGIFAVTVVAWLAVLTYPPSILFQAWPRLAYLTYYAPAYVASPYHNYPDHINAMVQWVRDHTPEDAVIVTPSRAHHFYYYSKRAVVVMDTFVPAALKDEQWKDLAAKRLVYLVEDNKLAVHAEQVDVFKRSLHDVGMRLEPIGSVPSFSPEVGDTVMHVYQIVPFS